MSKTNGLGRRAFLGVLAIAAALGLAVPGLAQDKLKVAGIWTVPVEDVKAAR